MKQLFSSITLLVVLGLSLFGCAPTIPTPSCDIYPCPEDSLTMTAAMGATFEAVPSLTPPAWATIVPLPGNLGWGSVYGQIVDAVTGLPIQGAQVRCAHHSYVSPYRCEAVTTTNSDGLYVFNEIFFHDSDRIVLFVEAPGYEPLRFEETAFTRPEFNANLGLFPLGGTSTPAVPLSDATLTPTP